MGFFLLNVPVTTEIKANLQDPSKLFPKCVLSSERLGYTVSLF